jgi:hypothetical protein
MLIHGGQRSKPITAACDVMILAHPSGIIKGCAMMDKKIEEIKITIFLENEDSQKFNLWLKDCFHELNEFYTLDTINSHTFFRFQKLERDKEYTNALINPLYNFETTTWKPVIPTSMGKPIFIKWIELGARLEKGVRLKVMITFPFDRRIINPVLAILFALRNDFTDSRAAILEALQGVKNTFQLDDSILPLPASTVGAGQVIEPSKQELEYEKILMQTGFEDTTGWDMLLIQMWNDGYSCVDVSRSAHVTVERVQNRKSEIRGILGKKNGYIVLPREKDRKAQMIKKS